MESVRKECGKQVCASGEDKEEDEKGGSYEHILEVESDWEV